MESKQEASADAQFLDAMNYALYSLVRFDGLVALVEGKQVRMDFAYEIDRLKRAMARLASISAGRCLRRSSPAARCQTAVNEPAVNEPGLIDRSPG
ncbi:hypothetical protein [Paraburkholderia terricola]|uniref:Uncharacterized protein n=1 Tax=Paraburkholderia terricola TaxID=169427 RepID=A0ABU1M064_9BURK|nr:hypothetical protein [Paraburkholderia terricola]MDR6412279.1 hypothetical protein [Paraburkholderia terricola]MDR6484657.1 hypothetical protein [Paraburkholderia terricola]